jgi:hypothetical protein
MKLLHRYFSPKGRIALPLIVLAALCFRDAASSVDVVGPSALVCEGLSFPIGWLFKWLLEASVQTFRQQHQTAGDYAVFLAAAAGSVLNIYFLSAFLVSLSDNLSSAHAAKVTEDEFHKLLDAHHNKEP